MTRQMLERNAQEETLQHARFLLEKALAVRSYTSTQVAPLLETQMKYAFLPQSVPAFSATEVLAKIQKNHPEYAYKEATLNPTNPRDRAVEWEADVIAEFRNVAGHARSSSASATRRPAARSTSRGRSRSPTAPACAATARWRPRRARWSTSTARPTASAGSSNEVVGAQMVSVPMAVPLARAAAGLGAVHGHARRRCSSPSRVALNLMLWWLVIRPVTRLSRLADRVSLGELGAPSFALGARDEIGRLADLVQPHAQEPGAGDEDARGSAVMSARPLGLAGIDTGHPLPQRLGKYLVSHLLGEGAMGVVYKAHRPGHPPCRWRSRRSARRCSTPDAQDISATARFRTEAQAAGRLSHPNIVVGLRVRRGRRPAYIAMEYVRRHLAAGAGVARRPACRWTMR